VENVRCDRWFKTSEYGLNPHLNCDSVGGVNKVVVNRRMPREKLTQLAALGVLLLLGGLALAGPSGLLAWGENVALLEQRQDRIAHLTADRDELKNRVALLDLNHADPDLVGELLRRNLNVVHPDEVVLELKPNQGAR
jgi:cell division protein FtsB